MKASSGLESLEKEYANYVVGENAVDNFDEFDLYLYKVTDGIDNYLERAFNQIQTNEKWQRRAKIRNKFPILFAKEGLEEYDYDNMILMEMSNLAIYNLDYFCSIRELANQDNFKELNKLINFLLDYIEKDNEYLELKRKTVDGNIKVDDYDYNLELMNAFVNLKLSKLEKQKQYSRN